MGRVWAAHTAALADGTLSSPAAVGEAYRGFGYNGAAPQSSPGIPRGAAPKGLPGHESATHKGAIGNMLCYSAAQPEREKVLGRSCMGTALPNNPIAPC